MTTAETISQLLNDNGQTWNTEDGRNFNDLIEEFNGRNATPNRNAADSIRYEFEDGSALVDGSGGWDFALDPTPGSGCTCFEGVGEHRSSCPLSPGDRGADAVSHDQARCPRCGGRNTTDVIGLDGLYYCRECSETFRKSTSGSSTHSASRTNSGTAST